MDVEDEPLTPQGAPSTPTIASRTTFLSIPDENSPNKFALWLCLVMIRSFKCCLEELMNGGSQWQDLQLDVTVRATLILIYKLVASFQPHPHVALG